MREFYELLERLDEKLREIACRIAPCKADQEDLLQEMRIVIVGTNITSIEVKASTARREEMSS